MTLANSVASQPHTPRILWFYIPAQGHINPTLGVLRALSDAGAHVISVNTADVSAQYTTHDLMFTPYPALEALANVMERASKGSIAGNALALIEIGEGLLPWAIDLVRREQPDLVVFDSLAHWGRLAAECCGVPAVGSVSTFVITGETMRGAPQAQMIGMAWGFARRMPAYWRIARRVKRRYGVQPPSLTGAVASFGETNIVYTARIFQPVQARIPETFLFVGASVEGRAERGDFPFDALNGRPIVYISLGTIHNQKAAFYRQCFEVFANRPEQCVLSVGKATDIAALGAHPANVLVRNSVPQLAILQRAAVFITHAGMNSVHEALWHGVPMICIPQQAEQAIVARQVEKLGAGLAFPSADGSIATETLRDALDRVMGDRARYAAASAHIGDALRAAGGPKAAAEHLLKAAARLPRAVPHSP
jgi:MGT family glycosyltransferase